MLTSFAFFVEPFEFYSNPITAVDNAFQTPAASTGPGPSASHQRAYPELPWRSEFRAVVDGLRRLDVRVCVVALPEAEGRDKPDAIFPNNSFSLHEIGGPIKAFSGDADRSESAAISAPHPSPSASAVTGARPPPSVAAVLYPMSPGRRDELPTRLIRALRRRDADGPLLMIDLREPHQTAGAHLEGTGAINMGLNDGAWLMCRSQRADPRVLHSLLACPVVARFGPPFRAEGGAGEAGQPPAAYCVDTDDGHGRAVYHTNVVGWCGSEVEAWCIDAMRFNGGQPQAGFMHRFRAVLHDEADAAAALAARDAHRAAWPRQSLSIGKEACAEPLPLTLLPLSLAEMACFAGNAIELRDLRGRALLAMSTAAWAALAPWKQRYLAGIYGPPTPQTASTGDGAKSGAPGGIFLASIPTIERLGGGSLRCLVARCDVRSASPAAAVLEDICRDLEASALE